MLINVEEMANKRKEEIKGKHFGIRLLIIQCNNDKRSNAYVNGKISDCEEVGFSVTLLKVSPRETFKSLKLMLENMFEDHHFSGVIFQEPFESKEISAKELELLLEFVGPRLDVDGFLPGSKYKPCTPLGILKIIENLNIDLEGKIVTVVGRGKLVGGPIVPMLMEKRATVISCNSRTPDLKAMTKQADIVISAAGTTRNLITRDMLKDGAIVIDAAIIFDEKGKMHGDCDKSLYDDPDILITPVPKGVGLMTRVALLENLIKVIK